MTDVTTRNRVSKGVRTGGQFAVEARAEASGVSLQAPIPRAHTPSAEVGGNSPWGQIQSATTDADGVTFVSTASHGGYKLSPERNRQVHPAWRKSSGWYEEDCERHIVSYTFSDDLGHDQDRIQREAQALKDWYPEEYTAVTGQTVTAQDSYILRSRAKQANEKAWRAEYRDDFIVESATLSGMQLETPGWTEGRAVRASDGQERYYLYPNSTERGRATPYLLSDAGDTLIDVTDIRAELAAARAEITEDESRLDPADPVHDLGVIEGTLTSAQRASLDKDLDKKWRFTAPDGSRPAMTLREFIAEHGVTGASESVEGENVRRSYRLHLAGGTSVQVSKATWEKSAGVPNLTTSYGRQYNDLLIAHNRLDRARSMDARGMDEHAKRKSAIRDAEAEVEAARQVVRPIQQRCQDARRRLNEEASAKAMARVAEQTGQGA